MLEKKQSIKKLKSTIQLPNPQDAGGNWLGYSFWGKLVTKTGSVEGKLHSPLGSTRKLLIFAPGCPGDGSSRLEKLWLKNLLKNNYTVFAARHNGTIINGKYSHIYLNCPQRQKKAKQKGQNILGDKAVYSLVDWFKEPKIVLEALAPYYDEIYLVGHSSGPLAIFSSLIDFAKEAPKFTSRVKRVVSLAGTLGRLRQEEDPILMQWRDYLSENSMSARVVIGNIERNIEILKNTYIKVHKMARFIPTKTELICINPWGDTLESTDEAVSPSEAIDMITTLGRGFLIIDKTQRANKRIGQIAHDLDNLKPEMFLHLVDKHWRPSQQISILG